MGQDLSFLTRGRGRGREKEGERVREREKRERGRIRGVHNHGGHKTVIHFQRLLVKYNGFKIIFLLVEKNKNFYG